MGIKKLRSKLTAKEKNGVSTDIEKLRQAAYGYDTDGADRLRHLERGSFGIAPWRGFIFRLGSRIEDFGEWLGMVPVIKLFAGTVIRLGLFIRSRA
jgi:hypothetical protein